MVKRRNRKMLLVQMSPVLHAKLKWKASQQGTTMSRITRSLIAEYIEGVAMADLPPEVLDQKSSPAREEDKLISVQEQIAERMAESLRD